MVADSQPKTIRAQTPEQAEGELAEPFDPVHVRWKPRKFPKAAEKRIQVLPYIDSRVVQGRLDRVLGAENWQTRYRQLAGGEVECTIAVNFPTCTHWVRKSDVGSRTENLPDADDNMKSAYSDAFKRAAVHYGIGRYLYRMGVFYADWDGTQVVNLPALPEHCLPADHRRAGPQTADKAVRILQAYCAECGRPVETMTSDFLAHYRYPVNTPFADVQVRHLRALVARVNELIGEAARKPKPTAPDDTGKLTKLGKPETIG